MKFNQSNNSVATSDSGGFTIIEIIIAMVIIATLTTITALTLTGVQARSRDSQRSSKITVISEALEKYYQENGSYPTCDELTKDPASVTTNILKGVKTDILTAPKSANGTNSITCINNGTDAFIYQTVDGSEYILSYIKEETGAEVSLESRYRLGELEGTTLTAIAASTSQINLSWTAVTGAVKYKIQRATDSEFKNNLVEETSTYLTLSQTGLNTGTKYYFRALARGLNSVSGWSEANATTTILAPASAPTVNANTAGSTTTFSWTAATCAAGTVANYQYRYTISGGYDSGWTKPTTPTATTVNFTTSTEGLTYTLQVQAKCTTNDTSSPWSSTGTASYYRPVSLVLTTIAGTGGTVSAGGSYTTGSTATITATPNQYYSFSSWSGSTGCSGTSSHTITMDTAKSCTAIFIPITITTPATPTVSISTAGSTTTYSWGATTCTGGATARYQYRYTTSYGYDSGLVAFSGTSVGFSTASEGYTYTVTVQAQCYNTATSSTWSTAGSNSYYRPISAYSLSISYGTGGTANGGGSYSAGSYPTITASPSAGYAFSSWSGSTGCSGTSSHTITMDTAKSCTANFIPITITTPATPTVSISTAGSTTTYSWGATTCTGGATARYQYRYTTSYGYDSGLVAFSGTSVGFSTASEGYTYTVTVQAQCYNTATSSTWSTAGSNSYYRSISAYSLSISYGTGGTANGGGSYSAGSYPTITASPSAGYAFSSWSGSTGCSGTASHTIYMDGTKSCTANFVSVNYNLALNTSGRGNYTYCSAENGTCSFTGTSNVRYGAYSSWYYKYNVAGSTACTNANFGDPISGYVKTCQYQAAVSVTGGGTYAGGTAHTITASPSGSFDSWTGVGCSGSYSHSVILNSNMSCTANFSNHTVDSPTPPPAPSAPSVSVAFVSNNAVLTINAVSCSSGTPEYKIRFSRIKYSSDSSWVVGWTSWSTTRTMSQTGLQGNKHTYEVIAHCNSGGTYSLDSTTASTNIIMDIGTPAAPIYAGPASFSNEVYGVVNFVNYCPTGTDLTNGTFTSNLSSTGNIWGPHPWGFNDHWTNWEGYTLIASYWGTYQCQTSFRVSPVSPQSGVQVYVYSG